MPELFVSSFSIKWQTEEFRPIDAGGATRAQKVSIGDLSTRSRARRPSENDFEVLHVLGIGAFSTVSLARSKQTGILYALKRLVWTLPPDRILKEVQSMMRFGHPQIVKIFGFYRVEEQVALILEYLSHFPFRDFLPTLSPS
jgi:serine/threonine protein kinase